MKLKKLTSNCRVAEANQVGTQIATTFGEYNIESDPIIAAIVGDINSKSEEVNIAWKRGVFESVLAHKDDIRDDALQNILETCGNCFQLI